MLTTGRGWRLGYRPEQEPYCALIGGESWGFELTATEWQELIAAIRTIQETWHAIAPQLMAEEETTLEQALSTLRVEASGQPQHYGLYIQLLQGRQCEGEWPAPVVPEVVQTLLSLPA